MEVILIPVPSLFHFQINVLPTYKASPGYGVQAYTARSASGDVVMLARGELISFCDRGVQRSVINKSPRRTFPQAEACASRRSGGGKGHGGSFVKLTAVE